MLIFVIAIAALAFSVRVVKQYEKGLVIRLGRYNHTADAGLVFLIPFIDSIIRVDMREALINVLPQQVITADNVVVTVDAVIYYKVVDPVKAEFEMCIRDSLHRLQRGRARWLDRPGTHRGPDGPLSGRLQW